MKKKIIISIFASSCLAIPAFLPLLSCSNNNESKKDPRDKTEDSNVIKVEIPKIEMDKEVIIKVTLKDGFEIDGYNSEITISGEKLSFANGDFYIVNPTYHEASSIRVKAEKVASTDITVKIVSKSSEPQPTFRSITFSATGPGTLTGNTHVNVLNGTTWKEVTKPTPHPSSDRYGCKFIDAKSGKEMIDSDIIISDMNIQAVFAVKTVTIYFDTPEKGITIDKQKVVEINSKWKDVKDTIEFTLDPGYKLIGWRNYNTEKEMDPEYEFITPLRIIVDLEQQKKITFTHTPGGTIDKDLLFVDSGTTWKDVATNVKVEPDKFYKFAGWYNTETGIKMADEDRIASDITVEARFILAETEQDCFKWKKANKQIYVTGLTDKGKALNEIFIPSIYKDEEGEHSVTRIDAEAFKDSTAQRFIIPPTIGVISTEAFAGSKLQSIDFYGDSNLYNIDNEAFKNCTELTNMVIPETTAEAGITLGHGVFANCTKLESLSLSASVKNIRNDEGVGLIANCNNLTTIKVDENNPVYLSKDNCIIHKNYKTLIYGCKNSIIPNDKGIVTSIGRTAFEKIAFEKGTSLEIPANINRIGSYAFSGCAIDGVKFQGNQSNGLSIGMYCFKESTIESVKFENFANDAAVKIDYYCFQKCNKLTTIELPTKVDIGDYAFADCEALTDATIKYAGSPSQWKSRDYVQLGTNWNRKGDSYGAFTIKWVECNDGTIIELK